MCCIENDAQGLRGVYQLVIQTIPQYLSQLGNLNARNKQRFSKGLYFQTKILLALEKVDVSVSYVSLCSLIFYPFIFES